MKDMVQVRRGPAARYSGPDIKIGRSQFNRSHGLKTSFDASMLVPILVDEVLPGDTFTCRLDGFARIFSPLDAPVMDNIELETFFFFCPTRILWDNWEAFNGAHDAAGAQDTNFTVPILSGGLIFSHVVGVTAQHLAGYFGLPEGQSSSLNPINALPFRMYNRVYNTWFRDQNLIAEETMNVGNGPDTHGDYTMLKTAKKHDYFTSCLPYTQKGTEITLSAGVSARIATAADVGVEVTVFDTAASDYKKLDASAARVDLSASVGAAGDVLFADLADGVGMTVNSLRQSIAIQRLLERDARGGTRYVEVIKAQFNVTSPDFRLQRPEYLGGGKSLIHVAPVANTSSTAGEDQGELRGVGTGVISGHGWAKSFTEHGYILGLVRARGDLTYFQGLDKLWSRSTRYDFYIPALAHLGEQSVLNKEIFVDGTAGDDLVFGYQERWAEYRMKKSMITGILNPDAAGAISQWHLAEDFSSVPSLNQTFVEDQTPMDRIKTVTTASDFILDVWFDYKCARPMPVRSEPSLMGRF